MSKCKYWRECELYDPESVTCNINAGGYYGGGEVPSCYIKMEEKLENGRKEDNNR